MRMLVMIASDINHVEKERVLGPRSWQWASGMVRWQTLVCYVASTRIGFCVDRRSDLWRKSRILDGGYAQLWLMRISRSGACAECALSTRLWIAVLLFQRVVRLHPAAH